MKFIEYRGLRSTNDRLPTWYRCTLWLLTLLFSLRIIGQLIQRFYAVNWLPGPDEWQGSTLPYWSLFSMQLIIMAVLIRSSYRHTFYKAKINKPLGKALLILGSIYFVVMTVRLLIGIFDLSLHIWFNRPVPIFFHIVLACFVLLLGMFHVGLVAKKL